MRAFAACLTVVLGFGVFSAVGCSSDVKTTPGAAGEAGASNTPAGGGGATSTAGGSSVGEAGASCSFAAPACQTCVGNKCMTQAAGCLADDACGKALNSLEACACDATKTFDECATAFGQAGKVPAADLVTCYNDNCTAACQ